MNSEYAVTDFPVHFGEKRIYIGDKITGGCTYHHDMYSRLFYLALDKIDVENRFAEFKETVEFVSGNKCIDNIGGVGDSSSYEFLSPLKQFKSGIPIDEIQCRGSLAVVTKHNGSPVCVTPETKEKLIERGWDHPCPNGRFSEQRSLCITGSSGINSGSELGKKHSDYPELPNIDSLLPDDILQVRHHTDYSQIEINLSSWDEYKEWENRRGSQSIPLPPVTITENSMHPILFEMLKELWLFEGYEVSENNENLFSKNIQKDYGGSINREIYDWHKEEYDKVYGDAVGFSHYFEFRDKVYRIGLVVID